MVATAKRRVSTPLPYSRCPCSICCRWQPNWSFYENGQMIWSFASKCDGVLIKLDRLLGPGHLHHSIHSSPPPLSQHVRSTVGCHSKLGFLCRSRQWSVESLSSLRPSSFTVVCSRRVLRSSRGFWEESIGSPVLFPHPSFSGGEGVFLVFFLWSSHRFRWHPSVLRACRPGLGLTRTPYIEGGVMLPRLLGYSLADLRRTSFCLLLSPFLRPPASLLPVV